MRALEAVWSSESSVRLIAEALDLGTAGQCLLLGSNDECKSRVLCQGKLALNSSKRLRTNAVDEKQGRKNEER